MVELAREHEILVVHDNAYSETTYDGYVAPSFLATPGAKEVGVEVFSLSKGYNMTGWRCAAILGNAEAIKTYWRLKTNVDSGLFEAVQLAGAAALRGPRKEVEEMCSIYERRRDLVVEALRDDRGRGRGAEGHDLHLGAGARWPHLASFAELVLEEAAVVVSPGSMYGPSGEGFFRISLTTPDELLPRGRRAAPRAPDLNGSLLSEGPCVTTATGISAVEVQTPYGAGRRGSRAGGESAFTGASAKGATLSRRPVN